MAAFDPVISRVKGGSTARGPPPWLTCSRTSRITWGGGVSSMSAERSSSGRSASSFAPTGLATAASDARVAASSQTFGLCVARAPDRRA